MTAAAARRWQASWIWPRDRREPNLHLLFRKDIELDAVPTRARLHLAAESAAQVILNGHELGRTAANSYPHQHYHETFDCAPHLMVGSNRLAVVVRYIGIPSSASIPKDPGLLAELVLGDGPEARSIGSDATWRALVLDAWRGRQRRSEWLNLDQVEILDHRRLPPGFPYPEDETGFVDPEALPWPGVRFTGVEPRPFSRTVSGNEVTPRLLCAGPCIDRSDEFAIPALAVSAESIEPQALEWDGRSPLEIPAQPSGHAFALLLDLGDYRSGRPELVVDGPEGARIDLTWDEKLIDGRLDPGRSRVYTADRHIIAAGSTRIVPEDWLTGRYLQLTLRGLDAPLRIERLRYREEAYPLHQRLRFASSDPTLERIVAISLQAVRRCMHDNIMDCPWRERRQWIGDVQRIALINHIAFGDRALVRAVLRQHIGMQDPRGRMWCCVPIWEEFPTQSMEWLRAVLEYEHATGDPTLCAEIAPNAASLHRWFLRCRDHRGLLFIPEAPVCNWMDNPYSAIRGWQSEVPFLAQNLRYLAFLDDVAQVFARDGRDEEVARALAERAALVPRIREHFTDPASGLLRDCPLDGPAPASTSVMAHGLAVTTLYDRDEGAQLWDRFEAHVADGAAVIPTSPFGHYHVHQALAHLGRRDAIVRDVLERWGPMVVAGADTTWEDFAGKSSRCHGWAGIPVVSLVEMVLGIDHASGGSARCENVGGVDWIEAAIG